MTHGKRKKPAAVNSFFLFFFFFVLNLVRNTEVTKKRINLHKTKAEAESCNQDRTTSSELASENRKKWQAQFGGQGKGGGETQEGSRGGEGRGGKARERKGREEEERPGKQER